MTPELQFEIARLKQIRELNGLEFNLIAETSAKKIAEIEEQIGFALDQNLKDLWQLSNGSDGEYWFAVFSDELTPCSFPSIEESYKQWAGFIPYDNPIYTNEYYESEKKTDDERIQSALIHDHWFSFAEFNGFSTSVLYDAAPTGKGSYGQIIVYQHDPDGIYYVAGSFIDFFKRSNDYLEENLKEIFVLE